MTRFLLLALGALLSSCGTGDRETTIVLPCGYVGWVNLIYELPGNSLAQRTASADLLVLAGDLTRCGVPIPFTSGFYETKLFYFCGHGLRAIPGFVQPDAHVSRSYFRTIPFGGTARTVQSFYVSANPLARDLPDDALPSNWVDTVIIRPAATQRGRWPVSVRPYAERSAFKATSAK